MFSKGNLPWTLIILGLSMAVLEEATYKSGAGGLLYGTSGLLKPVEGMLPSWQYPYTTSLSARYPLGYPIRIDSYLVITGIIMLIFWR